MRYGDVMVILIFIPTCILSVYNMVKVGESPKGKTDISSVYFVLVDRFMDSPSQCGKYPNQSGHTFCGGTLRTIIDNLDYIQDMGFDTLWITPVVGQDKNTYQTDGCAYHGYWAKFWHEIDERFGTSEDLVALTDLLHSRHMFFIQDVVLNHVGPIRTPSDIENTTYDRMEYYNLLDFPMSGDFKRWLSDDPVSYNDFVSAVNTVLISYNDDALTSPRTPPQAFDFGFARNDTQLCGVYESKCTNYNYEHQYRGWFYDLGDLNHSNPHVASTLITWTERYIIKYGVDGIRLDTGSYIEWDYLKDWSKRVKHTRRMPIYSEVTTNNYTAAQYYFEGTTGGILNYPLYYSMMAAYCGQDVYKNSYYTHPTKDMRVLADSIRNNTRFLNRMDVGNFVDNHDTPRIAESCGHDSRLIKNALALVYFMKGVPMIYMGTEHGANYSRGVVSPGDARPWQHGYIVLLNRLRKRYDLGTRDVHVCLSTDETIVLTDGIFCLVTSNSGTLGDVAFHSQRDYLSDKEVSSPSGDAERAGDPLLMKTTCEHLYL
jgi:alpha-amylase